MIFFSVGSYLEVVLPLTLKWKNGNQNFEVESLSIKIVEVLPGYGDGKHMDTLVTVSVNGHKIVVLHIDVINVIISQRTNKKRCAYKS